ncbi:MAG: S8 family serine peptidase [Candidatus Cloacimonetes bacterium]|nr:S8 family serine peptidase [Candidatus Cloacimonadota bacterium]
MNSFITIILFLLFTGILSAQIASFNEIIVCFPQKAEVRGALTGIPVFDNAIANYIVKEINPIIEKNDFFIYHISCEKQINFEELETLANIKNEIVYIQPNYLNSMLSITPNDPEYYKQWGLEAIKANQAWEVEKGNEQIIIGFIDSGIDYNHPDLADNIWLYPDINNNIWINNGETGLDVYGNDKRTNDIDDDGNGFIDDWMGWDFTDTEMIDALGDFRERDNDPMDDYGHGTHCAGIIGAQTNNNLGVAGGAWFCKLMNLRAGFRTPEGGFLEDDDVSSAIIYAVDNGAQIISISWGDTQMAPVIRDVCQYAYEMKVTIIVSAGNEHGVGLLYPAAFNNTISVSAVGEQLSLCSFSSYGEGIDLCAPGLNIISTFLNNEYIEQSGTSMSAPFVVGAVSLILSQNPLLTNDEIYDLLTISCDDLGEPGYDNKYGYGIINYDKFLQNATENTQPETKIIFPEYSNGFYQDFPIIGTTYCPNFFRYSLSFTDKKEPVENDWLDIITHNSEPIYYYDIVLDDTLAIFNTNGIMDSTYYLRLSVEDIHGNYFIDIIKIFIDKSPPEFIDNTTAGTIRYNFDKKNYYILTSTDEPVKYKATCFSSLIDSFPIINNKFNKFASLKLPDNLPDDHLSYFIKITNTSGLADTSEIFSDAIHIDNSTISTRGFENYLDYPRAGFLCSNKYDINHNGKQELVFMEFPDEGTYGPVKFCEKDENSLIVKYTLPVEFQPWSIGDTNGDEKYEIVGNIGNSLLVYETSNIDTFPDILIFEGNIGGLYGCTFHDLNNDNKDELLVNTVLDSQRTAYKIYTRTDNDFVYSNHWLLNNTPTYSKNELTQHIQFGDLNNNGKEDILLSDIDGDILIFEIQDDDFDIELIDTLSIPILNVFYLGIGDLDGDGLNEFIVGGYNDDVMNPNNQFWLYCVFKYIDDQFVMIDFTEISGVSSKNGVCVADLDSEEFNGDEAIITAAPDIYIYKLYSLQNDEFEFKPIWVGESFRSYYPVATDLDTLGNIEVAFNQYDDQDSLRLVTYHYPNPEDRLDDPPQDFKLHPINKESIKLRWRTDQEIDFYKISRELSGSEETFIVDSISTTTITYIDTFNILADSFYYYQVKSRKGGKESYPTLKKLAVPTNPPILDSIKMISLNSIQLNFDKTLNQSCVNLVNYKVMNIGYPESAVLMFSDTSILLTFDILFDEDNVPYEIYIKNIEGFYHAQMSDTIASFEFKEDLVRPYITSCTSSLNNKEIQILFSKTIEQSSAICKDNYRLIFPEEAGKYEIYNITHNDNKVDITFSKSLKPTGESYYIKVTNIKDLAGNTILPGKNLIKISIPILDLESVKVFPNPVVTNNPNHDKIKFQNLPTSGTVEIFIYNFAGEPVKKITAPNLSENYNWTEWNLKNSAEKEVASGMYLYLMKYSNKFKKGKIAVIR